ncbi:hypothetical protein JX265_003977 [Neoarthrinium moseri]|uniref:FAD-binding FR-type domain-containing protein n=1 Tax=Neoarthrinium moseri TaxID=1658444 RepID=A0A9P9WRJ1_9PEZI|nr:hypothetical protein JX265_003977 [Neoarthrinium moseri]
MASKICSSCFRASRGWPRQPQNLGFFATQHVYHRAPLQASYQASFSTTASRPTSTSLAELPRPNRGRGRKPLFFSFAAIAIGSASWYGLSESEDDSLNTTRFTPFNIISKEQVSPTAFILTIRCPGAVLPKNASKFKAAWEHGLWSVEMKQPQLQIARHYTPLPPLNAGEVDAGEVRFLIRKMDGGEMSNYLSRLQVGDQVWLRGPHYGFDIKKRLGDAQDVVFVAGGTGIAPALQIAHKLLDASSTSNTLQSGKLSVRILWANRKNVDSLGREQLTGRSKEAKRGRAMESSLTNQVMELQRKHGDSFTIDYFVDDERFIAQSDINAALGLQAQKQPVFARADKSCRWHSHERLASVSDEEDRTQTLASKCTCRPHKMPEEPIGRNLVCVSGPDGFIEAFAGSKRWFGGREIQGPVLGLLGSMKRIDPRMDDWLVLKM